MLNSFNCASIGFLESIKYAKKRTKKTLGFLDTAAV